MNRYVDKKIALAVLLGLLFLCLCCPPGQALAQENQNALSLAWITRSNELQSIVDEVEQMQQSAQQLSTQLGDALRQTQTEIARFLNLYQVSRNHPTEQLTLLQQMQGLQRQLQYSMRPLEDIAARVNDRLEEIVLLKRDMDEFDDLDLNQAGSSQEEIKQRAGYENRLNQARKQLNNMAARIDKFMLPIKTTSQRLNAAVSEIEKNLLTVWEGYYFTEAGGSLDSLNVEVFSSWIKSLPSRFLLAYPQTGSDWLYVGGRFALNFFIMGLVGFIALRASRRLPKRWSLPLNNIITHAWVWVSLGLSILLAARNQLGGMYFTFTIIGVLVLIWGLASLSWRLRVAARPSLEGQPSPMARLFVPAAIGVVLLYSDLPPRVLMVLWAVVMVVFGLWLRSRRAKQKRKNCAMLERISYGGGFYFAVISLIIALFGYARLAILFYMLLFALVNTLTLGNALSSLSGAIVNKLFSLERKPVANAIVRALAIPGAWIVSLLCTLPWIWAVPGAIYLLQKFISADYTIGEASFDFSRVVLIAVLFFLFRSFIALSKTWLTHLPDRMPHLESGIIPPLRSLVRYLLWIIYALIVLGILGVNFTSLAVVAGGLSVGIGLGMQNLFSNLVSGLMLIFGKTVLVGDYVEMGGVEGTIKAVNIRSILIETPDRSEVFVPNSTIMAGQFINWTRSHRMVRRTIKVGVAYGTDVVLVMNLLKEAASRQEYVLPDPAPYVWFTDFADSTLNFSLMVFIDDLSNAGATTTALRVDIEKTFREHDINIAFPQLDVHLHGGENSAQTP